MPAPATTPAATEDASLDLLVGIADAVSATLRPESGWQSQALSEGAPAPEGARVVQAILAGVGRLVVAVDAALARSVQVGPPPAEDLLDGLTPALQAAAGVVGSAFGADVTADEPQEVSLSALTAASDEEGAVAVLIDGDKHRVTVAVFGPRSAEDTTEPAAHAFDDLGRGPRVRGNSGLELLHDVEMGVTAELGRTRLLVREILELCPGSVIELDRAAGSPVDVLVNGTLIARGEVVVVDEEFGVRITDVIGYDSAKG
jgi:flagellar motor switch protein FliN/FliY